MTLEPRIAASADAAARIQAGHYRFSAMLDSERIKIISVRSTVWALLATAVAGIGLSTVVPSAQAARYTARTAAGAAGVRPHPVEPVRDLVRAAIDRRARSPRGDRRVQHRNDPRYSLCRPATLARAHREGRAVQRDHLRRRRSGLIHRVSHRAGDLVGKDADRLTFRPERPARGRRRRSLPRRARTPRPRPRDDHPAYGGINQRLRRLALRSPDHCRGAALVLLR